MVLLPDGTLVPNEPPPTPMQEPQEDPPSGDEYDHFRFYLGQNLGGRVHEGNYGRLPTKRVRVPHISRRPLQYSTTNDPARVTGVYCFSHHYAGKYAREYQWSVFYHSPPGDMVGVPGTTTEPYPDHPGPPLWVPVLRMETLCVYRCNCILCRNSTEGIPPGSKRSRHLWAFTAHINRVREDVPTHMDPKYLILRVASWVFSHENEVDSGGPLNEPGAEWLLRPDHHRYKHWFYYHNPVDPTFEGRPVLYVPAAALQLGRWE